MAQADKDRRLILYPTYIDSTQTVAEGRCISKESACAYPDVVEMLEACKKLNIPAVIEDKHYPRTWWIRGRLRVIIKNADGAPLNPAITSKLVLLRKIAETIKNTPNRPKKVSPLSAAVASASSAAGAPEAAGPSTSGGAGAGSSSAKASSGGGSSKKKKGKK